MSAHATLTTSSDFEQAYAKHNSYIRKYLTRLGCSVDELDDFTQQTWLHAWRAAGNFTARDGCGARSYLCAIARNVFYYAWRKPARTRILFILDSTLPATEELQLSVMDERTAADQFKIIYTQELLEGLRPAIYREMLIDRHVLDMGLPEIAAKHGFTTTKVKTMVHRALLKVRENIDKHDRHTLRRQRPS